MRNMPQRMVRICRPGAIVLVLLSTPARAADIFVAPGGSDENSGASPSIPLRTIAAASDKAHPGDHIQLMPGRYLEAIRPIRSGQPDNPIIYRGYGAGRAIISGSSATYLESGVAIGGVSNIVIDGVDVDGVAPWPNARIGHFATVSDASHIVIRNGNFRYAHGWHGIGVEGASDFVTIEDNVIDQVGAYDGGSGTDKGSDLGDSVSIGSAAQHVLVQRNRLNHGGHNLLRVAGRNCVVQDNIFDNDWRDVLGGDAGQRSAAFMGRDNLIQRNLFSGARRSSDSARNPLFKVEGTGNVARQNVGFDSIAFGVQSANDREHGATYLRIYNNTFYRLGSAGWRLIQFTTSTDVGHNAFVNNLLVDANTGRDGKSDAIFSVADANLGPTAASTMFGNIVYASSGRQPTVDLHGFDGVLPLTAAQLKYPDLFWNNGSPVVRFKVSSPRTMSDFDLQPDSMGVDRGEFLTRTTVAGTSRQLRLQDARYFVDGFGLIEGDLLQLEGTDRRARVTAVDYVSNVVTLAEEIEFSAGQGVALAYSGSRPDVGAREYGAEPAAARVQSRKTVAAHAMH